MINYGSQKIFTNDTYSIRRAVISKKISQGKFCNTFEKKLKKYIGVKNVILCNSGTSAIHLAIESLDLKKGSCVIMPAVTFIATYSICSKLGLNIFLADIDPATGQITTKTIKECIKKYQIKPKLIITMYMGGNVFKPDEIFKLKKKYKCKILEDACHAFGTEYHINKKKYKVGSCKHADICTFSFHPLKTITTGEGGCVTTNDQKLASKIKLLSSHGIIRDQKNNTKYDIKNFGYNFRLSDINAALGISQLKNIKEILNQRQKIYNFYAKKIKDYNYVRTNENCSSSNHLFIIRLKKNNYNLKMKLLKSLKKNNILAQYHYIPIYKFSAYKKGTVSLQGAEIYYKSALSLPIHLNLKKKELYKIVKILNNFNKT